MRPAPRIVAASLLAVLAACSDKKSDPPPANAAPVIVRLAAAPDVVAPGGTVTLAVAASDPNGDALIYEWLVPAGWTVQGPADQATLALQAPAGHGEAAFVRVQVKDGRGGEAAELAAVRTTPAGAVQLRTLAAGPSPVRPGGAVALEALAESAGAGTITYAWSVSDPAWSLTPNGASATLVAPYAYERPATVTVTASDGESAPATGKVVVSTAVTTAPEIGALVATPAVAVPGATIQLTAAATGAYGLGVTYAWSVAAEGWTLTSAGAQASLVAPGVAGAATAVTVTVTDAAGASSSTTVAVRTSDPTPVVSAITATPSTVAPGRASTLAVSATSPAGRPLAYTWTSSDAGWTLTGAGPVVTATAPLAYGRVALVTVAVDDGAGWSASTTAVVATSAPTPPVVTVLASPAAVPPGAASQLTAAATSPSGLPLTYAWSCASPSWTVSGSGATVAVRAPAVPLQATTVTVVVTDAAGASSSSTVALSTLDSTPVFSALAASPDPATPGGTVTVAAAAASPVGNPLGYEWSVSDAAWSLTPAGASATLVAPPAYGRSATVTVVADDGKGGRATARVLVSTSPHQTPTITALVATPPAAAPGGSLAVSASASSPSGLPLTYLWSASDGWSVTGSGASATVVAPPLSGRSGSVTVTVSDSAGASATSSLQVATVDSTPVLRGLSAAPSPVRPGGSVTLSAAAESPIGAPLTYTWTHSGGAWALTSAGATATLVAPNAYDDAVVVTVEATDPYGARASERVVVSTMALAAPAISALTATPPQVDPGGRIALSADATSPAGLALAWSWAVAGEGWTVSGGGASATATAPLARSSTATVTVTATDAAGATATRSLSLSTSDAPPTTVSAAVAGSSPRAGVVGRAVLLDASGSTSTGGGVLLYAWSLASAPAGAAATLVPSGAGDTALLTGGVPGRYVVEVTVTDAEGARATATTVVDLAGASSVQVASGDGQVGTAGDELALPLEAVVRAASGEPVPNVPVTWWIAGGRLLTSASASDANGVVRASVRLGRIAAAGSVTVALRDTPSASASFTFTGQPGAPASLAVRAERGTADTGLLVRIRTVDAYGNESTDATVESETFALSVSSGSGLATFGVDVDGVGTLVSGGGTASIVGQLAGGQLDVRLADPRAETVTLSLGRDPAAAGRLPFSAWRVVLEDAADRGVAGWSLSSGVEPWRAVSGAKAASPSQAFGVELSAAEAIVAGTSSLTRSLGALPYPLVRLEFLQQATVTAATDAAARCAAQPALTVALRSGSSESPIRPAPVGGWPVQGACDGREGFAATSGFEVAVLDLTDATAAGYTTLSFELANAPRPATAAAPVAWYVDDVLVQALTPAAWAGASTAVRVRPGAPASITLGTPSSWPVLYGQCVTGQPWLDVVASVLDANGNLTEESTYAFGLAWTGSAALASVSSGAVVAGGTPLTVRADGGRAVLRFTDAVAESLTFTLSDPEGRGLTLGPDLAITTPYYCHSTGNGLSWSDTVPTGTITTSQAIRACETYYGTGRCTYSSGTVMPAGYSYSCGSFWRWTLTSGFGSYCGSAGAATASLGYWSSWGSYSCGWWSTCYYCTGACGSEGGQQFYVQTVGGSWN